MFTFLRGLFTYSVPHGYAKYHLKAGYYKVPRFFLCVYWNNNVLLGTIKTNKFITSCLLKGVDVKLIFKMKKVLLILIAVIGFAFVANAQKPCSACYGYGVIPYGNMLMPCIPCGGTGIIMEYVTCSSCRGSGVLYNPNYGNVYCNACNGTGKVVVRRNVSQPPPFTGTPKGNWYPCKDKSGCLCTTYKAKGVYNEDCANCGHGKHQSRGK